MLRFAPGVQIIELTDPLVRILRAGASWSLRTGTAIDVNSIDDKTHGLTGPTLHGLSLAIDLDTVGDRTADLVALRDYVARVLPPGFDVVLEADHLHVEYDTKRLPRVK